MQHPAARLFVWGVAAAVVQLLDGLPLYLVAAAFVGLAALLSAARLLRLLRRTRWLLLAITLLFAYSTPGMLLLPDLGAFSPSSDGLHLAAIHLARIVAVLCSIAVLLEFTPPAGFVEALYGLLAPAARIGVDRSRIAVRLMLVMQYAESARGGTWRDWLEPAATVGPQRFVLVRTPLRWGDAVALGAGVLLLACLLAA